MRNKGFMVIRYALVASLLLLAGCGSSTQKAETAPAPKTVTLTVSAAASLTDAMNDIKKLYVQEHSNVKLTMTYGASGGLEQQIEQGAPVDVFISAASKQMDDLQNKNLLLEGTRKNLLKNQLVLVVPRDSGLVTGMDSLSGPDVKKIAIGDPSSVPAGQYAQESLTKLGLWNKLSSKMVNSKDVRQVLSYVEAGNVEAGFVFLSDAKTSSKVKIVTVIDEKYHSPIVYPLAVVKASKNPDAARAFIDFLSSDKARRVFEKYGFSMGQ